MLATVIATITDRDITPWETLKDLSGSTVLLACNITTFYVLILVPGGIYAFNHISVGLIQQITR